MTSRTTVAEAVGTALVGCGVGAVFGVVGSGNFAVTNAMVAAGARFVAARHEGGAATMADAHARMTGRPVALSVHQGCGLTNAMTGITEAAKSRTPLLVLAAEATAPTSNFAVDQAALAAAVGAVPMRVTSAGDALDQVAAAVGTAVHGRRTVLLNLPLDVQVAELPLPSGPPPVPPPAEPVVTPEHVERLVHALRHARRPVFVAGRGARGSRAALEDLAARCGALLATSAVAKGLFRGDPWSLDVSGGFASPLAAELIAGADLVVGWGCALNMWTMRHGRLIGRDAVVVQVDDDPAALGVHRDLTFGVVGDVRRTAEAAAAVLGDRTAVGYRTPEVRGAIAERVRWRDVPFTPVGGAGRIDPRTLTIALDDLLPAERVVAVDSGNFMGYPSMFLDVPDEQGFCFTQAFQSVGLGLASAIGAALARPDRLPVAALGDGGALMAASELETVVRLGLPMVVVVYDDAAYGAEVHHFGPEGHPLDTVRFPDADLAAIARGYGFVGVTVRGVEDLAPVADWVAGARTAPLFIDAKVAADEPSWWLEEAFRGH
jgi:thiamine pyrophosphate-dependent acetolactate synthase large subunit-like protein